jgi:hypothetical protein
MAQHRGLIITLVTAVLLGCAFIGVMALTTNDSHASVHDELSGGSVFVIGDPGSMDPDS